MTGAAVPQPLPGFFGFFGLFFGPLPWEPDVSGAVVVPEADPVVGAADGSLSALSVVGGDG